MINMRKGDVGPITQFRASRFLKEGGKWYFQTREGSTEGPFADRCSAELGLELHLKIFRGLQLEVFDSGLYALTDKLRLEPIQMQWR